MLFHDSKYAFYAEKMIQEIEIEQEITNEMADALSNGEFQCRWRSMKN